MKNKLEMLYTHMEEYVEAEMYISYQLLEEEYNQMSKEDTQSYELSLNIESKNLRGH